MERTALVLQFARSQWTVDRKTAMDQSPFLRRILIRRGWNVIDFTRCFPNVTCSGLTYVVEWLNAKSPVSIPSKLAAETTRTASAFQLGNFRDGIRGQTAGRLPAFADVARTRNQFWRRAGPGTYMVSWVPNPLPGQKVEKAVDWDKDVFFPAAVSKSSFLFEELNAIGISSPTFELRI